ncbi:TetR/AcrR family transcriptional regulator [Longispora sp. NPDC051575]|uniref:TetR/AcrR family transcriptional regulator n=1 Tax=Longispora sp. NPDC051575 TaxID=3154943 RepID=UPI00341D4003
MKQPVSSRSTLLDTATALLRERGWSALSLDTIAERAGVSRATVWRAGLTRTAVERVLRQRLADDYRELMWAPLTGPGPGDQRLAAALMALCAVAERNLPLLAHTDTAFHGPDLDAAGIELDFFGPWMRILELAAADGSLPAPADPYTFVGILSNAVLLTYVHLRAHHAEPGDTAEDTARQVVALLAQGYLPR